MSPSAEDRAATPRPSARRRFRARTDTELADPLLRSAYSLAVNSVLTGGLGMAFWIVAARIYPSDAVGRDSALIAAMVQISTIAQLNLNNSLILFLPGRAHARRILLGAYAISGLAAVGLGTGFVLVAPRVSEDFAFLTREPLTGVAYVAAVLLWGIFALQDAALTAMRHAPWVVVKNSAFGVLKLLALPVVFVLGSTHGPFIAWVVPMCLLLLPVNWLLFRRIFIEERPVLADGASLLPRGRRQLTRFLALDYLATVFINTSITILPLLILGILGSSAAAHFYIPLTVAMALDAMFWGMTTSLVTEGTLAPHRAGELVRLLVRRVALLVVPVIVVLTVAAPLVMAPFGEEYVRESTNVLRILLVASLFRAAMLLAAALWRLEGRGARIAALDGCMLVGLLCATVPLAHALGVIGVAVAWLGTTAAAGCAVGPTLMRYMRPAAEVNAPTASADTTESS